MTANSLNTLGLIYGALGRFSEAEQTFKRSLAIAEKAFGPNDRDVGALLDNLASLYVKLGRYGDAEPLYSRGLAIRESAFGRDHPNVSVSLNNIAHLFTMQGRAVEAEPLYRRALAISEERLGLEHPQVGTSLHNLAELYRVRGLMVEAEPLYKRSLALFAKAFGPEHSLVGSSLGGMAELYRLQGRYLEAEPLYKRSLRIHENTVGPDHALVGTSLTNLAALYSDNGRHAEALPLLYRSWVIRKRALGPNHPDVALTVNNLAATLKNLGRVEDVENLFLQAISILERALSLDHYLLASAVNNLAEFYFSQGRLDEAEPLFKRSLVILEKELGRDHPSVATEINNLAELYRSHGRYAEAEPLYKRSLAIRETALGPEHPSVGTLLNNLAWLSLARNDLAGAADRWRRATVLLQRRIQRGLGEASEGSSKGEALRHDWYFEGLVKTTHRLATEGRGKDGASPNPSPPGGGGKSPAAEMFETAQWGAGSEAGASLAQMAARSAGGSPQLAALVRERQDLVAEWQAKDKQLISARSEPPARRNAAAEKGLTDRLAAIDVRRAAIDARLARDFPDYAALASPKPSTVADVQASLRDDEALVLFLDTDARFKPLPEETFVWVVTKSDVRWLRSDLGTGALRREVAALRCGLDHTAWYGEGALRCADLLKLPLDQAPKEGAPLPLDAARAHALYKGLLGEATDLIRGKHLIVVPSGALTTLPFQVLVTEPPKSKDLAEARWLVRDHALTVLPSVSALKSLRRTGKPSAAAKPMLGFANPLLDGDQFDAKDGPWFKQQAQRARAATGCAATPKQRTAALRAISRSANPVPQAAGLADLAHLRAQTPLPETADEVCEVARSIGADVADIRIGAKATEAEVKRLSDGGDLAKYRILHFATHGLLAGQLSGTREPGLILTPPSTATAEDDGYLSGSEIASLKLDADWVILSACNTAGGSGNGEAAEALSGLARVFFYAGARALLVSHWEVDSHAAVKLVTGAIGALAKDKSIGRAEAMRRAMLAAMADPSRPSNWVPAWHPSVWAPFVVVGEGGAGR